MRGSIFRPGLFGPLLHDSVAQTEPFDSKTWVRAISEETRAVTWVRRHVVARPVKHHGRAVIRILHARAWYRTDLRKGHPVRGRRFRRDRQTDDCPREASN